MVLPVLSAMLVAIIFGGITFFNYVELGNAVEAGGRQLGQNGRDQGTAACSTAVTALQTAAGNLKVSLITTTESFASGNTCTSTPLQGDAATISAYYPCNLPIPFTGINLCPVTGGSSSPVQNGVTLCPTTYCIVATTTVYVE